MGKALNHRLSRWLRIAAAWAVAFHGFAAPWAVGTAYAKNPDTITLGVTPISAAAPDAITDLLASANPAIEGQISLSWTAPQGNAGGVPINNQPVASYTIHLATFSVASLGGNTTAWWNSTTAGSVSLQAPANTPQAPGQFEAYTFSSLVPGATYYFGIKSTSQDSVVSPIDTASASPALQAFAVATQFVSAGTTPMRPNGLAATLSAGQFTLSWRPVTLAINQQSVSILNYIVYRYDAIGGAPTNSFTVPPTSTSYTDTVGGLTYYYRVVAVGSGGVGVPSAASDYVDSSSQLNRYALSPTDVTTRVVVPMSLAVELNTPNNGGSDDYEIVATHQPQNENTTTLKSYLFQVRNARTSQLVSSFVFTQPIAAFQVSYSLSASVISLQQSGSALANPNAQAQAIAQLISLYWFNGSSFIRLGGTVLLQDQALTVTAKNLGLYEIRAISMPASFALTRNSPYPRVITPNGAENRRVFWFFDNPADEVVTGTIYDVRGAKVRDLAVSSQSPTPNSLVWDGRDMNGAVVPSGVYLYKIEAGKEKQTGTVVVAR